MNTVTIGKSKLTHASRDGIHPVCKPTTVGKPAEARAEFIECYSCRPIVKRSPIRAK